MLGSLAIVENTFLLNTSLLSPLWGTAKGSSLFFFFFMDHFLKRLYCVWYNIASALCFGFGAMRHMGSQLPDQGWNLYPCPGRWSLHPSPAREVSQAPVLNLVCLIPSEPQVPESKSTALEAMSPGAVTMLPCPAKGQRGI